MVEHLARGIGVVEALKRVQLHIIEGVHGHGDAVAGLRAHGEVFVSNRAIELVDIVRVGSHGQVRRRRREAQVVLLLREPFQELAGSVFVLFVGFRHRHAGALLRGNGVSALEGGRHDDLIADLVRPVVVDHPVGEVRRRCGGTRIADDVARLHIIGAELAHGVEIAADVGDVVVVPQAADLFLVRVDLGFSIGVGCEQVDAHLLHADDEVVGQGIAAVERLAVVGDLGRQRIGVFVVALRGGRDALLRCQVVHGCAGCLGERLPVGFIEHGHLGRLRHWQKV